MGPISKCHPLSTRGFILLPGLPEKVHGSPLSNSRSPPPSTDHCCNNYWFFSLNLEGDPEGAVSLCKATPMCIAVSHNPGLIGWFSYSAGLFSSIWSLHLSPFSLNQIQIEKYERNTAGHLLTLDPIHVICNFQDTGLADTISNVCHLQTRGWPTLWTGWTSWGCDPTAQDPPLFCSLRDRHNYLRRWEKAALLSHVNSFAFKMCPNLKVKVKILGSGKIFKK